MKSGKNKQINPEINDLKVRLADLESVLENSLDAGYRRNLQTDRYDYMSPVFERITGWSVEEMASFDINAVLGLIHPDDLTKVSAEIERTNRECAISGRANGTLEYRFKGKDGQYRWLGDSIVALADQAGQPLYRIGNVRDITSQKITEQALRDSEERYRMLVEIAPEGIAVHRQGKWVFVNAACLKILGADDPSEIIGKPVLDFVHPHDRAAVRSRIQLALESQKATIRREIRMVRLDSKVIDVETTGTSIIFEGNQAFQIIIKDISERKQADAALRASEEKFRTLFEKMAQGVVYQDADGKIILANPAAERILGLTFDQMTGRTSMDPDWRSVREDGSDFPGELHPAVVTLRTGKPVLGETMGVFNPARQSYSWMNVSSTPLFRPGEDKPYQVFVTFDEITEQKLAKEALQASEERYRSLFNGMTEGFALHEIICDDQGAPIDYRFLEINPSFERLTGLKRENVVGKLKSEALPGDDPHWLEDYGAVALTGQPIRFENHSRALNRFYEVFAFSPKPRQFAVLFMDITERRRAEEQISLLARFPLENPNPVMRVDSNGLLTYANAASQELLKTWGCEVNQYVPEEWKDHVSAVLTAKTKKIVQIQCNGDILNLLLVPIVESRDVNLYGVNVTELVKTSKELQKARDELERRVRERTKELELTNSQLQSEIAERKRVEDSLHLANTYNRSLIEASLDPLVTITFDGKIGDVNAATEFVTGCQREELIGTDFHRYFTDPDKAQAGYNLVFEFGSVHDYELEIRHKNGQITPVLYNASIFHDDAGQIKGVFAAARNISRRKQAEQQIQLQTAALEAAANGIFITDRLGKFLWCNPSFSRMTGYALGEIIGHTPRLLKSGFQNEQYYQQLWQTILSGKSWQGEVNNRRKDGSIFIEEQVITPMLDADGKVTCFIAIQQDISERKKAEQKLLEQERLLSSVLETLPVGVWVTDVNGETIRANPARQKIWGDVRYIKVKNHNSSRETQVTLKPIESKEWAAEQVISNFDSFLNQEIEVECLDGSHKNIIYSQIPLRDETNQVQGEIFVSQEITELKQIQQTLEADRQQLLELSQAERDQRIFAESLVQATLVLNSSLQLEEVFDDILEQILHVIPFRAVNIGLLTGKQIQVVHHHGFENLPDAIQAIQSPFSLDDFPLLQKASTSRLPQLLPDVRQEPDWVILPGLEWVRSYTVAPLLSADKVIGFLNIFGDQVVTFDAETVIKRLNVFANQATLAIQNARLYEDLAKALEKEKAIRNKLIQEEKFTAMGRMLASVSHEMNNPLQTIKNYLFLIKKASASDSFLQEYLDIVISETARIANLVAQLRELYRPQIEGQLGQYPLARLLDDVHRLIAPHLANQKVSWKQNPGNEHLQANCVADHIKQVFINLCMNSIEAMQPAGGMLTTDIILSQDGQLAGVVFQDSGPGIPAHILPNIFEPFFTTKTKGLGLGLSICYEIVQGHKGQINVESKENQGATFTVWLPLVKSESTG